MQQRFELPVPSGAAREHGACVATHLHAVIAAAGGWIDFARFMEIALYAPGIGYYSAGATKFGPAGDFVTAPEISPLFARCLARACAPLLAGFEKPVVVEFGAGSGVLAAELLPALAAHGLGGVRYRILEVSGDLRQRQRLTLAQRVPRHLAQVEWLDAVPDASADGVVIANEVADALPVSRFTRSTTGVLEQGVISDAGGFTWAPRPAGAELADAVSVVESSLGSRLPPGYTSEISLRLPGWVAALGASLRQGLVLICDYGGTRREIYHPERCDGTLACHYRHRAHHDPLILPGLQDITAWVDFSAAAAAGEASGLAVAGYTTQAHYLVDAGIDAELAAASGPGGQPDLRLVQQAKTLLLPGEMGERFKVLALARGGTAPESCRGFGFRDLRHLL
ncbi:MAG: SAM-dependent methyltransferase [Gammaproteobacteria bacterium]|nr:SAM-dependent methyltransferase [Gammaproteobacteria bacterium]